MEGEKTDFYNTYTEILLKYTESTQMSSINSG